jgi:hypothetical protein
MTDSLELRAFAEGDLESLERLDTDPAALGPFEWVGFAREGVLRGAVFRAGAWRDLVLYALLRERWGSG